MTGSVIVTGPAVHEEKQSPEVGLSFAVTLASHAAHIGVASTFYVHLGDTVVGRTDSYHDGSVEVRGPAQLGAKTHA